MDTTERTATAKVGALSLYFTVTLAAQAAPPPAPAHEPSLPPHLAHLDLRAPTLMAGDAPTFHGFFEFPTARHRDAGVVRAANGDEFLAPQIKPMNGVQRLADRFTREGMPVARLWENHAALLSVGLNQRGKPGLWLIQKTR